MAESMLDQEERNSILEDDYYTFFNIPRNASQEDITYAYRRLSKVYHPDKHSDPERKEDAELLFSKTKKAYEVLIDPHKRAIYDTLGVKGLETDGWEIVQRTKTPQEIREEYEQLAKEREERRLQQRTNPKGVITVGIDATDLFETYEFEDEDIREFPSIEISTMAISQSIEAPLSLNDTLTLNGSLATQNGTGHGTVGCSLRHVLSSKTWTECEMNAGNGLVFSLKGFRTITKRCFSTVQGIFSFTPHGIEPGIQAVLARQLDKHTVGYLTWKAGHSSSMTTTVVWDSPRGYLAMGIQFGIPNTFVSMNYTHKLANHGKLKGTVKIGTFGTVVEYGCETKISQHSVLGASVMVGVPTGVTLKIKVTRANQNYVFPIILSEELIPSAVFYGTIAPLVGWYALKVLVINPYQEKQRQREIQKSRETNAAKLAERKKEATAAVALMQETYKRIVSQEQTKGGLILEQALYGKLPNSDSASDEVEYVDVTVPLQCLIKDSKLVLLDSSKSNLPGFYDPCLGDEKSLLVKYKYKNLPHEVIIQDHEPLRIPKDSHLVQT